MSQSDNTNDPFVSLVITSYNRADLVAKTIESVLLQDYSNMEIVISDDGSTDSSDEVIRKYTGDPRIKYYRNSKNIGMLPNFKKATYDLAKGEFITYVSSDDRLIDPSFISDSIRMFRENPKGVILFSRNRMVTTEGVLERDSPEEPFFHHQALPGKEVFFKMPEYGTLSWGGCMMRRDDLIRIKAFQNEYVATDIDNNYKIMLHGDVLFLNKVTYEILSHDGSATSRVSARDKILHLECLEGVAKYAKSVMPEKKEEVEKWLHYFVYVYCYNELKFFRVKSKKEFSIFRSHLKEKYPAIYSEIMGRWKMKVFYNFYPIVKLFHKTA